MEKVTEDLSGKIGKGTVHDMDIFGRGVVRWNRRPIFIPGVLPGDEVEFMITGQRKKLWEGKTLSVITRSRHRRKSPCPYSHRCGGCDLLELDEEGQGQWKERRVKETLMRIGGLPDKGFQKILQHPPYFHYRNHLQFLVKNGKIGFREKKTHRIVEIRECIVAEKGINEVLKKITGSPWLNQIEQLALRENHRGEIMAIAAFLPGQHPDSTMIRELKDRGVTSFYRGQSAKGKGHFRENFQKIYETLPFSQRFLEEEYTLSPGSFFQVHRSAAEAMARLALDQLNPEPGDQIWDLYCGMGTTAIPIGKTGAKVQGIDYGKASIEEGRRQSEDLGLKNVSFTAGSVEEGLKAPRFIADKILLDPPRGGCSQEVLNIIGDSLANTIVYISCNPATLARDLKTLGQKGYMVTSVTPVDLFPQTLHVETVVLMSRK